MPQKAPPTRAIQRQPAPTIQQHRGSRQPGSRQPGSRQPSTPTQVGSPTTYQSPVPPAAPQHQPAPPRPRAKQPRRPNWLLIGLIAAPFGFMAVLGMILMLGAFSIFSGSRALPGVSAAGVELGGLSAQEASERLRASWTLQLSDGSRLIPVNPATLGITLDADATAQQAVTYGRSHGDLLLALVGSASVPPVINIDIAATQQNLDALRDTLETPPQNAGISLVNGVIEPRPPVYGKSLDLDGTLAPLRQNAAAELADGILDLAMIPVAPQVTDATALVEQAGALLANALQLSLYDPISGSGQVWTVAPETWIGWLTAGGSGLSFDAAQVQPYIASRQNELPSGSYLDPDESIAVMQDAITRHDTNPRLRIYHHDSQHTVQSGETLISIAWDYGMPYPWLQQANPGVETLSIGQTITIPSPDVMLPLPITWDKRVVVSMSEQRVRVYENGALKWDWLASTGIASSPTWRGVYQIQSHEPNAYAGNWDLWMPNFLGVYRPVPSSDFMNGFHGFPTRGTSQLLWTNDLGTRVTYGCILLSNENAQALYNWAEEGVVVEITA